MLIAPALLVMIFGCMQFALWYYAGGVARAAATEGAQAGAAGGAGFGAASAKANEIIAGPGRGILHADTVRVATNGANVTVTVTAQAPSLILGMSLPVQATSSEPLEVFRAQSGP